MACVHPCTNLVFMVFNYCIYSFYAGIFTAIRLSGTISVIQSLIFNYTGVMELLLSNTRIIRGQIQIHSISFSASKFEESLMS